MKNITLFVLIIFSLPIYAHVGGIVCLENGKMKLSGIQIDASGNSTEDEILEEIFLSIEKNDPVKGRMFRTRWEKILNWTTVRKDFKLRLSGPGEKQESCEGSYFITERNQVWLSRDVLIELHPVERALIYLELILSHERFELGIEKHLSPELIAHYFNARELDQKAWLSSYFNLSRGSDSFFNFNKYYLNSAGTKFTEDFLVANFSNLDFIVRFGVTDVNLKNIRGKLRYSGTIASLEFPQEVEFSTLSGVMRVKSATFDEDEKMECVVLAAYSIAKKTSGEISLLAPNSEICFTNEMWDEKIKTQ